MTHAKSIETTTVGRRIEEARQLRGLSQGELSRRLNTAQQNISRYESGKNDPKASTLREFCIELDVSPSYLLGLTEDPRPDWNKANATQLDASEVELLRLWSQVDKNCRTLILAGLLVVAGSSDSR